MARQDGVDQAVPQTAILQLAANRLGPISRFAPRGEMTNGGDGFGAAEQRHARLAGGDGMGKLIDQMLRPLPTHRLQDRPRRVGPDPARHGAGEVVRPAERRHGVRRGNLELTDGAEHIDVRRQPLGAGVGQSRSRRPPGQVGGRQGRIVGRVDPLGGLADTDDDGRMVWHDGGLRRVRGNWIHHANDTATLSRVTSRRRDRAGHSQKPAKTDAILAFAPHFA